MYLFHNDYNEGCHSRILEKLQQLQSVQFDGYGTDIHCNNAADYIRKLCQNDQLFVHFLVGGTQTNLTVIAAALRPYQAVFAAESAHIHVHETGAIEATGHKVVTLPSTDGKITAQQVSAVVDAQRNDENAEHNIQVKLVYISNPTELGTTYNHEELAALSAVCRANGLYLYMDGARLGYALTAADCDLSLDDLAQLCDVFYIGGTKCGAMFGEAVVFSHAGLAEDFRYMIKQRGGMLAKGWLLGVQFETLLENGLYFDISRQANIFADRIRETIEELGFRQLLPGTTNQVFAVLPNDLLRILSEKFTFMVQQQVDSMHTAVRFCTSWATSEESVNALCCALRSYAKNKEVNL